MTKYYRLAVSDFDAARLEQMSGSELVIKAISGPRMGLQATVAGLEAMTGAEMTLPAPGTEDSLFAEILGRDTEACCLAHHRKVCWHPAPMWWTHSDHRSCMMMRDVPAPLVFVLKDGSVHQVPGERAALRRLNAVARHRAVMEESA